MQLSLLQQNFTYGQEKLTRLKYEQNTTQYICKSKIEHHKPELNQLNLNKEKSRKAKENRGDCRRSVELTVKDLRKARTCRSKGKRGRIEEIEGKRNRYRK